jgi:hypothetical protein
VGEVELVPTIKKSTFLIVHLYVFLFVLPVRICDKKMIGESLLFFYALQRHNAENLKQIFPEKKATVPISPISIPRKGIHKWDFPCSVYMLSFLF